MKSTKTNTFNDWGRTSLKSLNNINDKENLLKAYDLAIDWDN